LYSSVANAHHNPVVYDGKRTVELTGVVTAARFAFPHSRYLIDVVADDGSVERWTLMTEDPRDAEKLGFADALREIAVGDPITVVGWPNKIKAREIRGHQLHYPDGRVVMMRRGNYIWTTNLRRIRRLNIGLDSFPRDMIPTNMKASAAERVIEWIDAGDPAARVALEIKEDRAALIGIDSGEGFKFAGVREPFECHTKDDHFRLEIETESLSEKTRQALSYGAEYIKTYNDLLVTYWEYDVASC
jgi:hypothetical protein